MKRDVSKTAIQWAVTRIDGKIASVSNNYAGAAKALAALSHVPYASVGEVTVRKVGTDELFAMSDSAKWEDLMLFGSPFQKEVWRHLFDLTHTPGLEPTLMSYSDFAASFGKGRGVRAVAHAIGLNPVAVIIPCHLIIPKESIERLLELESENGLFSRKALYVMDNQIDYGEYALGPDVKRLAIHRTLGR